MFLPSSISAYFLQQKALLHRNYRLFMAGQTLSQIGTWIQRLAMIWLAYKMTGSTLLLGLVGFCEQIPIFLAAPLAGVFADRWNKHRALCWLETLALIQAFLLGILTLSHLIRIWEIILLSLGLGSINAFEVPIRQSFVVDMVDQDKPALTNAIAINSTLFNLSRLIGPSLAGALIATTGEGWCFMINSASFGAVLVSLLSMRIRKGPILREAGEAFSRKFREGFAYIRKQQTMMPLLVLLGILSMMFASVRTLAPVFAKVIFHGNAGTLGWLMTSTGVGAISGALYLTNRKSTGSLKRILSLTGVFLGISLILFSLSSRLFPALLFLAFTGLFQMLHVASTNTLLQMQTDDDKRGRVMSFYTFSTQGMMPFGSLMAGSLATFIGAPRTLAVFGVICLFAGYFLGRRIRPRRRPRNSRTFSALSDASLIQNTP